VEWTRRPPVSLFVRRKRKGEIMRITVILPILLCAFLSTNSFASTPSRSVEALRIEQTQINESIKQAKDEDSKLSGGLIKALIGARLQLLEINAALVQQRIHALESGAKIKVKLYEAKPNPERARNLKAEIESIKTEIKTREEEIAQYRGGLIKVTLMSSVATMNNTLAMLQNEYLKAKYGIYWMPDTKGKPKSTASSTPEKKPSKSTGADKSILIPTIANKRFQTYKYDDNIWFDVTWNTDNLKKKTRAVKGVLIFADLFGEPKFMINYTVNDPLTPRKSHKESGVGFEYNQFKDSHKWMRASELKDMSFQFKVKSIIYADGTTEQF